MKNKGLMATIIILLGVIVMLLVTLLFIKMPSFVVLDGFDFMKRKETVDVAESTEDKTEPSVTVEIVDDVRLDTTILTYEGYNGNVSIEYPEIVGMSDSELQKKINSKLKTNALSIVPLYPISTALQNLNIYCEVNYLDKDYITVLYSGEVVGKSVKKSSSVSSNVSSGTATSNGDPYLGGFVDPLANQANANIIADANFNATHVTHDSEFGALPLPKVGGTTTVGGSTNGKTTAPESNTKSKGATNELNGQKSSENEHTADIGPVVYDEPTPTSERKSIGNGDNQNNTASFPGTGASPQPGAPMVNGFAGSNMSASTIDQKIFYTNTINLKTGLDVKLSDVADPATLAKYARSSKAEFVNVPDNMKSEVRAYVRRTIESTLTEQLATETDFRNDDLKVWPKHFSFIGSDGDIYFTVKLSSKLGNYVIIKYKK